MDGFQVLAIVRRKFPALRVVVMTGRGGRAISRPRLRDGHRSLHGEAEDRQRDHQLRGLHRVAARTRGAGRLPRRAEQDARRYHPARVPHAEFGDSENHHRRPARAASGCNAARSSTPRPGRFSGKEAFVEMLRWKIGQLRNAAVRHSAPAHHFQQLRKSAHGDGADHRRKRQRRTPRPADHEGLAAFAPLQGRAVRRRRREQRTRKSSTTGAARTPSRSPRWIHETSATLRDLGERLEAGQLEDIEALGPQRHLAMLRAATRNFSASASPARPRCRTSAKP